MNTTKITMVAIALAVTTSASFAKDIKKHKNSVHKIKKEHIEDIAEKKIK